MKLQEAYDLSNLRTAGQRPQFREKTKTALELAEELFAEAEERGDPFIYLTPESWSRKWLPSKTFYLMNIPLNAVALPCQPKGRNLVLKKIHAREEKPILVDENKCGVGGSLNGYVPERVVLDGKHRLQAAAEVGRSHILAFVGENAIKSMEAEAESYRQIKKTDRKKKGK